MTVGAALLLQVVPAQAGGVRDHAGVLAGHWQAAGLSQQTLSLPPGAASAAVLRDTLNVLRRAGAKPVLLLHFSGYGYGARGLCDWLPAALAGARADVGLPVLCLFHELFAVGLPPWRSAFWLSPWQRRIVIALLRCSDAAWTATERHAAWLRAHRPPGLASLEVRCSAVFSNVGEPETTGSLLSRRPSAVVFGSPASRRRVQRAWVEGRTEALLAGCGVRQVCEIGDGPSCRPARATIAWHSLGPLPAAAVSDALGRSRACLVADGEPVLAKSSVLAAAAAHRCVAINLRSAGVPSDGLTPGRHLVPCPGDPPADPQGVADALHEWYSGHRAAVQATQFAQCANRLRDA